MSNKDDNNIFIKSLTGVEPLKKSNKITKPIPKPTESETPRTIIKETEGDKIYDPFMGTGTTAVVAKKLKRNYIGSELLKDYCNIAKKKLDEVGTLV